MNQQVPTVRFFATLLHNEPLFQAASLLFSVLERVFAFCFNIFSPTVLKRTRCGRIGTSNSLSLGVFSFFVLHPPPLSSLLSYSLLLHISFIFVSLPPPSSPSLSFSASSVFVCIGDLYASLCDATGDGPVAVFEQYYLMRVVRRRVCPNLFKTDTNALRHDIQVSSARNHVFLVDL